MLEILISRGGWILRCRSKNGQMMFYIGFKVLGGFEEDISVENRQTQQVERSITGFFYRVNIQRGLLK